MGEKKIHACRHCRNTKSAGPPRERPERSPRDRASLKICTKIRSDAGKLPAFCRHRLGVEKLENGRFPRKSYQEVFHAYQETYPPKFDNVVFVNLSVGKRAPSNRNTRGTFSIDAQGTGTEQRSNSAFQEFKNIRDHGEHKSGSRNGLGPRVHPFAGRTLGTSLAKETIARLRDYGNCGLYLKRGASPGPSQLMCLMSNSRKSLNGAGPCNESCRNQTSFDREKRSTML